MKILTLHTDYIKYKPLKKAIRSMADLPEEEMKGGEAKDALVVMTAVEKIDDNVKEVAKKLVKEVKDIAGQVKIKNVVLYPYAHLSKDLASPEIAGEVLVEAEKLLKKTYNVSRAPFGYYKEFELKVKGHPLSELSREIMLDEAAIKTAEAAASGEGSRSIGKSKKKEDRNEDPKKLLRQISKSKLDTSKLKENDHRIIGSQMDLFSFNETAPGMVFWHNNGLILRNELMDYARDLIKRDGFQEVLTPQILDKKLWKISGHWDKYRDNIFLTDYEDRDFAVKPMNCPGGCLIFKSNPRSYKDLPIRAAEFGVVHRQELSGVLGGLFRVIQFTQDDAHIYCSEKQLESEIKSIMKMIDRVYSKFGFKYSVELSTRPEKRIGDDKVWDKAEKALKNVLDKSKMKYKINKGDGAFYGPKIDFHLKDSLNRTWQCGTIQLDFSLPERFELEYTDKDNKKKRPVMLHRTVFGSLERFIGILIEHLRGRFPTWLAPVQVRVLNFTDRNTKAAEKVLKKLEDLGIRVDSDFSSTTMGAKVKNAELIRIPYIVTIGDKEEKEGTVAVRKGGSRELETLKVEDFISRLHKEIEQRK